MHHFALELRKYKRSNPIKTIAIAPHGVFQVTDISEGGLSFKCFTHTDLPKSCVLSVLCIDKTLNIKSIPAEIVWEAWDGNPSFSGLYIKQIGLKFCQMNQKVKHQLEQLLQNDTRTEPNHLDCTAKRRTT